MYHLYCFLVTFISCVCVTNNHNILAFSSTIWVLFSSFPNPKGTWKPLPTSAAPSSNACCHLYLCDLCSFNPKCRCDWQIIRLHFTELSCIVPSAALEEACVGLSALSSLLFPLLFNTQGQWFSLCLPTPSHISSFQSLHPTPSRLCSTKIPNV